MTKKKKFIKKGHEEKPKGADKGMSQLMSEVNETNPDFVKWLQTRKPRRTQDSEK